MKLSLRPTTEDDLDFVLATESDPEAAPWLTVETHEAHRAVIDSIDEDHLIVAGPQGERLGYVVLSGLTNKNASIEVRRIAVAEHGKGVGREALRLAVDRCFADYGAHRVWLDVKPANERAKRVYTALGFVYEGTMREAMRDGDGDGWSALELMSVLEHEWR